MKLIGITGKSGAGKTTLADMLGKNENVGVIHTDQLMHKMEREKLPRIMESNQDGEKVGVKKNIRKLIYENKYIFLIFIRIKGILLNRKIEKKIEELERVAKEIHKEITQIDERTKRSKFFKKYECKVNKIDKNNKEKISQKENINQSEDVCKKGKEDDSNEIR